MVKYDMEKKIYRLREGAEQTYQRYSEADIEKANSISILDWAKQQGYSVKEERRWAEIKGQGGLTVDKYNNRWYCHSSKAGGGPIQLLIHLQGIKWTEAVRELLGHEGNYQIITPRPDRKEPSKEDFTLPEKNNTYKHMYAYLVKSRRIHPEVIDEFVKKKLLYENNKNSCVFVGTTKEGSPKYANIRSTNTVGEPFKGDAALSDKRFGFARVGSNNVLTIFEAPIDLLSYMTIFKIHNAAHIISNDHLLSLGGVSDTALIRYLEDHPEITKIRLGLDNDQVGNEACMNIHQLYSMDYEIERIQIKEKDFNETLKVDIEKIHQRQLMEQLQQNNIHSCEEELEPV
jgi:hypothetical protein